MNRAALANVVAVLDEPQDVVNIAGVMRAMMNMGLERLRLVSPADFDAYRIAGIAHRSEPLIEATEIFDRLEDAVADAIFVVGSTARSRTAQRNYARPRELGPGIVERAEAGTVALLFGREDRGLSNQALDLCNALAVIPTDPGYPSLNLAQAFLLLAYEVFLAAGGELELPSGRRFERVATREELENTCAALEDGLRRIDFFKAREAEGVMRVVRTVLGRAEPDLQEAGILRAIGFEIGYYLDRLSRTGQDP